MATLEKLRLKGNQVPKYYAQIDQACIAQIIQKTLRHSRQKASQRQILRYIQQAIMTEGTLALTAGSAHGFANALVAEVNTLNPLIKTEINNGFSSIANHTVSVRFLFNNR